MASASKLVLTGVAVVAARRLAQRALPRARVQAFRQLGQALQQQERAAVQGEVRVVGLPQPEPLAWRERQVQYLACHSRRGRNDRCRRHRAPLFPAKSPSVPRPL